MLELDLSKTAEEKAYVEKWKKMIGVPAPHKNIQEIMSDERSLYFFGQGRDATLSFIQKFAGVNEDYNALYFDEEYAKKSRWNGIIAPPLYPISVTDGLEVCLESVYDLLDEKGALAPKNKFPTFFHCYQADAEWEFFEPVRPGDTIDSETKLIDMYWKQGKKYRLLFFVDETIYTNQHGKKIARFLSTDVRLFR